MNKWDRITYNDIKYIYQFSNYEFNQSKYNINLFGLRHAPEVDAFNDLLGVAYMDEFENEHCLLFKGTTKPGLYYLGEGRVGNQDGTFILAPGFYKDCWMVGTHKGYPAFQQKGYGIFKGWRDNNRDGKLDYSGKLYDNVTGLNGHRTNLNSIPKLIGPHSAGCQVVQFEADFQVWFNIGRIHVHINGNSLNYALFQMNY